MTPETSTENRLSGLLEFLGPFLSVLWKDWPNTMQVTTISSLMDSPEKNRFSLSGKCPHCMKESVLMMVTNAHVEYLKPFCDPNENRPSYRFAAVMQCPGCSKYVLAIVTKPPGERGQQNNKDFIYEHHYPMGKPDDTIGDGIPGAIGEDFKEALRCRWVHAYNATVEMCRRALQASCLQFGADPRASLEAQIDSVHSQGKITTPLREMAHKIRLGGNRGAHPPDSPNSPKPLTDEDADAVIAFTKEYFHHVYVMPELLAKFSFSKSTAAQP